jgi:hypothetical protein
VRKFLLVRSSCISTQSLYCSTLKLHMNMSLAYAQKAKLTLCATPVPYSISTPRGRVVAGQMVHKIPLKLVG